jgi:hypothetical protein
MEAAADFCQQQKKWDLAHRCYRKASELYMSGGRHTAGTYDVTYIMKHTTYNHPVLSCAFFDASVGYSNGM